MSAYLALLLGAAFHACQACQQDTGVGCLLLHLVCAQHGPSQCVQDGPFKARCQCDEGYCAVDGVCVSQSPSPAPAPHVIPSPAPAHHVIEKVCQTAFQNRCFARTPFRDCCGKCTEASARLTCSWGWGLPCCPDLLNASFPFEATDRQCVEACSLLSQRTRQYTDYCPGGEVETAISNCPAAVASLHQHVPAGWCTKRGHMDCRWRYSWWMKGTPKGHWQTSSGDFRFTSEQCLNACSALGSMDNRPQDYCQGSAFASRFASCPEAQTSLHGAVTPLTWCDDSAELLEVPPFANHSISPVPMNLAPLEVPPFANRSISPVPMNLAPATVMPADVCSDAWTNRCFNHQPWTDCCEKCSDAGSFHTCDWHYQFSIKNISGHLAAPRDAWAHCDDACDILGDNKNAPQDYCPGGKVRNLISNCPKAVESLEFADVPPSWCSGPTVALLGHDAIFTPGAGLVTGAFVVMGACVMIVKLAQRLSFTNGDYDQLLG